MAGQASDPGPLENLGQGMARQSRHVGADLGSHQMERLELSGLLMVVLAPSLEMLLPSVTGDRHLQNLRRPFVDRGDAHVPSDLFDHVLSGVSIAAQGLNGRIRGSQTGLASQVLGDRSLGVEATLAGIDPLSGLFDEGSRREAEASSTHRSEPRQHSVCQCGEHRPAGESTLRLL